MPASVIALNQLVHVLASKVLGRLLAHELDGDVDTRHLPIQLAELLAQVDLRAAVLKGARGDGERCGEDEGEREEKGRELHLAGVLKTLKLRKSSCESRKDER